MLLLNDIIIYRPDALYQYPPERGTYSIRIYLMAKKTVINK